MATLLQTYYLNAIISGQSIHHIRKILLNELEDMRKDMNSIMSSAITFGQKLFLDTEDSKKNDDLFVSGQTRLMNCKELSDIEKLKTLFDAFSEKNNILHLLDKSIASDGVKIFIGAESGYNVLDDCSVISAPYEFDNDVEIGDVGELVLKSAANMRCYLNKDAETSEVLKDGWLYTGDLAKIDKNELITLVDRKKNIIIRGGENISAQEVQTVILEHPDVIEAAIFALPNERLGEIVGSCVFCGETSNADEDSLKEFLRKSLAAYKIPEHIWFKKKPLPRVASEKIDVEALKKEYS